MFKTLFKSEMIRNISLLIGSNAIGQAIAMLAYILLTHLYSNSDFGVFAIFLSVTGLLSILGTATYEEAIIVTKTRKEYYDIIGFTLKLLTGICLFLFLILWCFHTRIFALLNMESITGYWYIIPITVLFTGLFTILTYIANRAKKFKQIASSNISLNTLSSAFKIVFKYISTGATGLITGNLVGQIGACFSFYKLRKHLAIALKGKWKNQKKAGIKYKAFPLFNMNRNFINSFSGNLPFLLLAGFFGEASLGLFSLALTLAFRPISLVAGSLYKVFFEKLGSLQHNQMPLGKNIKRFWKQLFLFGIPSFILIYLLAPYIFDLLFDKSWTQSHVYFRIILPWMFCVLLTTPLGFIPVLFHKQHIALSIEIAYFIVRVVVLYIGVYFNDFLLSILLFSITGVCFMIGSAVWYAFLVKKHDKQLSHD